MGTTLTGTTPQDTYDSLIKVTDNGPLSGTAKYLSDGLGNDSALAVSTTAVGVGTATPYAKADIFQNTAGFGGWKYGANLGATDFPALRFLATTANTGNIIAHEAGSLVFLSGTTNAAAGTERVRITSAGNVGIGTSSPDQKLNIVGSQTTAYAASSGSEVVPLGGVNMTLQNTGTGGFTSMRFVSLDSSNAIGYMGFTNTTSSIGGAFVFGQRSGGGYAEQVRIQEGGGISFNGDTAAANALDDYEEGTFTPNIAGSTSAGTASYTVQSGNYTKIGRQVSISIDLLWSSGTGTGSLRITGLPFTNISTPNAATIGYIDGITFTALNYATSYIPPSTTRIEFVGTPTGGGSVTDVSYDSAGRIIITATYFV